MKAHSLQHALSLNLSNLRVITIILNLRGFSGTRSATNSGLAWQTGSHSAPRNATSSAPFPNRVQSPCWRRLWRGSSSYCGAKWRRLLQIEPMDLKSSRTRIPRLMVVPLMAP